MPDRIFVTGGTGYLGRPLIAALIARGYDVHALVRRGSDARLPPGVKAVIGDALDVAHPAPVMEAYIAV